MEITYYTLPWETDDLFAKSAHFLSPEIEVANVLKNVESSALLPYFSIYIFCHVYTDIDSAQRVNRVNQNQLQTPTPRRSEVTPG